MKDKIIKLLNDSIETKSKLISDDVFMESLERAINYCFKTITEGNTIFFCAIDYHFKLQINVTLVKIHEILRENV